MDEVLLTYFVTFYCEFVSTFGTFSNKAVACYNVQVFCLRNACVFFLSLTLICFLSVIKLLHFMLFCCQLLEDERLCPDHLKEYEMKWTAVEYEEAFEEP